MGEIPGIICNEVNIGWHSFKALVVIDPTHLLHTNTRLGYHSLRHAQAAIR